MELDRVRQQLEFAIFTDILSGVGREEIKADSVRFGGTVSSQS
jgi:hypothetical protein